jgi:hypothetical protein
LVWRLSDEFEPVLLGHAATGDIRCIVVDLDVVNAFDAERRLGQRGHRSSGDAPTNPVPADPVSDLETCGTDTPVETTAAEKVPLPSAIA